MGIEYKLGKTSSGRPELSCGEKTGAIVTGLDITGGFSDCIHFENRGRGLSNIATAWLLESLVHFKEMKSYERLIHMPKQAVRQLASRIYEFLYMRCGTSDFSAAPVFGNNKRKLRQILEELTALQATEKRLAASGELIFPKPVYEQSHPSRTTVTISAVS